MTLPWNQTVVKINIKENEEMQLEAFIIATKRPNNF